MNNQLFLNLITSFMPSGHCYHNSFERSFSNIRGVWLVFIIMIFIEIPVLNANSEEPDQTSDLSLHCLLSLVSLLWDARHNLLIVEAIVILLNISSHHRSSC